jgi:hypothetical protein
LAKTSASNIAPAPVKTHPISEIGPAAPARVAGSMKMPEPIMLPTTSAVAIQRPSVRLSFGGAVRLSAGACAVAAMAGLSWTAIGVSDAVARGVFRHRAGTRSITR